MTDLPAFICRVRTQAGLSQTQLGALLGVNQTAISQWEHGIAEPGGGHLFTLLVKLAPASLTVLAEHTDQHHPSQPP
jgi:transcriptional regulator with XRE-family HTH domain